MVNIEVSGNIVSLFGHGSTHIFSFQHFLFQAMEVYLEDYNISCKAPMDLVMFKFAIEHVSRICRVLRQPNGHALLVGQYSNLLFMHMMRY